MRNPQGLLKKAPLVGAFFVLATLSATPRADVCDPPAETRPVSVRHVHDGDTLVLGDNTRVRLIGINAPELGKDGRASEPLAIRARERLRQLLFEQDDRLQLLAGSEARDRHGRLLAHLWLADGGNVSAALLEQGLGWFVAVPPNVRLAPCYRQAEHSARQAQRGVWRQGDAAVRPSTTLTLRDTGFQIVRGRVARVGHGGGATWINLEGRFAVRIPDHARDWFSDLPDRRWVGRELEVRGWVYQKKGELRVNIGHPAALRVLHAERR